MEVTVDIKSEIQNRVKNIEEILSNILINDEADDYRQKEIFEAMNYSITAGGKRLRPMLMLETMKLFDGIEKSIGYFMAAMEMIHTYSLVHDDLPAIDNDDYRRGRKTTHIVYGEAMGILAGDALLNYAFETGLKGAMECVDIKLGLKALQIISNKSGVFGMIGGQVVDIKNDGKDIDIDTLDYINELKTGALIEASMMAGAVLAGASDDEINTIESVASKIGRAFQIQDDILDVISTDEELGKPVHSDEKNNKSTYVILMGLDKAQEKVKELTEAAMSELKSLGKTNEFLNELLVYLINRRN